MSLEQGEKGNRVRSEGDNTIEIQFECGTPQPD